MKKLSYPSACSHFHQEPFNYLHLGDVPRGIRGAAKRGSETALSSRVLFFPLFKLPRRRCILKEHVLINPRVD